MSLMPRSRLIIDSPRSPRVAVSITARPMARPGNGRAVEQQRQDDRPTDARRTAGAGEPLPRLLRADVGRHRMLAEQHAGHIAADIAEHGEQDEGDDAIGAVVLAQQQRREAGEERHVQRHEDARGHVAHIAGGALGQPPDHRGEDRQRERHKHRLGPAGIGSDQDRESADGDGHHSHPYAVRAQRVGQLPQTEHDGERDDAEEGGLPHVEREEDQGAQAEAHTDGRRQVAPGAAASLRRWDRLHRDRCHRRGVLDVDTQMRESPSTTEPAPPPWPHGSGARSPPRGRSSSQRPHEIRALRPRGARTPCA